MTRWCAWALLAFAGAGLLWPAVLQAGIDAKNANYFWSAEIEVGPREGVGFNITYNSRTLYDGLFGFGWCSDLESRLEVQLDGAFNMIDCGAGEETRFELVGRVRRPGPDLAEVIARRGSGKAYEGSDGQPVALDSVANVRKLLAQNVEAEWLLKEVGLKAPMLGAGDYVATDGSRASFDGAVVQVARSTGKRRIFDAHGTLLEEADATSRRGFAIVSRSAKAWVVDVRGVRMTLVRGTGGHAERVRIGDRVAAVFHYVRSGTRTTLGAIDAGALSASFAYDDLVNMTARSEAGRVVERIKYNQEQDWALAIENTATGCVETSEPVLERDQKAEEVKRRLHLLPRVRKVMTDNGGKPGDLFYSLVTRKCRGGEVKVVGAQAFGHAKNDSGKQRFVASTSWFDASGTSYVEYGTDDHIHAIIQPPLALPSKIDSSTHAMTNVLFSVRYREPNDCAQELTAEGVILLRDPLQPLPFRARAKRTSLRDECVITAIEWQTRSSTLEIAVERGATGASNAVVLNGAERWQRAIPAPATQPTVCSLRAASLESEASQVVARVNAALKAPCAPAHWAAQQAALVFSLIQSQYTCNCSVASATEHRVADFARWIVRGEFTTDQPAGR